MRPPQPQLEPVPASGLYLLTETWVVRTDFGRIAVPSGFCFDGASIPWIAEPITFSPFHPKVMQAAMVHDLLYASGAFSRRDADRLFWAMLRANGVRPITAWLMFAAVRLFAAGHYGRDRAAPDHLGPDDTTPIAG